MEGENIPSDKLKSVDDFFYYPRLYFKSFGINITISNGRLFVDRNTIIFYISSLDIVMTIIAELAYLFTGILAGKLDIFQITYVLISMGFSLISAAKTLLLIIHMDEIVKIFYEAGLEQPKNLLEQKKFSFHEYLNHSNFIVYWYAYMNYVMVCCFTFFPLYTTISNFYVVGEWIIELPYSLFYPFDPSPKGIFLILYFVQVWAAVASSIGIICVDTTLCVMVRVICMPFKMMKQMLLNYQPESTQNIEEKRMFIRLIKKHNLIFE